MINPLVSVIIPTFNSWKYIKDCLESIINQNYNNIEIIIVDNYSEDNTKEISREFTKFLYDKWPERTTQKNYWIKQAKWKYVLFIDSDMILTQGVIEKSVKLYEENLDIWWICIPENSIWNWFFVKIRDFERKFYAETAIESARFFKKDDVIEVWWFEEDLVFFEESLLPQKIESKLKKSCKYRIMKYINHNESDINLINWLKKKYYYWKSLDKYTRKVKEIWILETSLTQIWIINRYKIFLKNKKFYSRPILAFWVIWLKTLEFASWWLWFLFNKVRKKSV